MSLHFILPLSVSRALFGGIISIPGNYHPYIITTTSDNKENKQSNPFNTMVYMLVGQTFWSTEWYIFVMLVCYLVGIHCLERCVFMYRHMEVKGGSGAVPIP